MILLPQLPAYLINVFLYCCGIGQKLVVQSGLLHGSLYIISEPQAVDDGLEGYDRIARCQYSPGARTGRDGDRKGQAKDTYIPVRWMW